MTIGRHGLRVQSLFESENLRPVCRLEAERTAEVGKAEMARECPLVGLARSRRARRVRSTKVTRDHGKKDTIIIIEHLAPRTAVGFARDPGRVGCILVRPLAAIRLKR